MPPFRRLDPKVLADLLYEVWPDVQLREALVERTGRMVALEKE